MKKTAVLAVLAVALMVGGCSNSVSDQDPEVAERCAELEATVIEGDTETAEAARESIERTIEQLCD